MASLRRTEKQKPSRKMNTAGNAVPANAAHSRGGFTMSVSLSGMASPGLADVNAVLISRIAPRGSVTLARFPADERPNAQSHQNPSLFRTEISPDTSEAL